MGIACVTGGQRLSERACQPASQPAQRPLAGRQARVGGRPPFLARSYFAYVSPPLWQLVDRRPRVSLPSCVVRVRISATPLGYVAAIGSRPSLERGSSYLTLFVCDATRRDVASWAAVDGVQAAEVTRARVSLILHSTKRLCSQSVKSSLLSRPAMQQFERRPRMSLVLQPRSKRQAGSNNAN